MYNLISWYNQNRKRIWITILTVVGVLLIGWRLMYIWSDNNQTTIPQLHQEDISSNLNSISLSSQKSAITGQNTNISKEKITIIDNFVSYCNSGNLQQAYNLITNECKEEMFPNINRFQEIYYKPIFSNGKRTTKIENWYGDIYIVDFNEDALSTGVYSTENNIRDYMTITKDSENNYKLNINKYIGRTELNKTVQEGNLQIKVIRKDAYMDYETYSFEIKNNANNKVLIANINDDENISYLEDKNNIKYSVDFTRLTEGQLTILPLQTKELKIKYFNPYISTKVIKRLVFPKVFLNYDEYTAYNNKANYTKYGTIYIDL